MVQTTGDSPTSAECICRKGYLPKYPWISLLFNKHHLRRIKNTLHRAPKKGAAFKGVLATLILYPNALLGQFRWDARLYPRSHFWYSSEAAVDDV